MKKETHTLFISTTEKQIGAVDRTPVRQPTTISSEKMEEDEALRSENRSAPKTHEIRTIRSPEVSRQRELDPRRLFDDNTIQHAQRFGVWTPPSSSENDDLV